MEDEKIVALYWDRDEGAIRETERKYDRYLTRIAYNILNNLEDRRESVIDVIASQCAHWLAMTCVVRYSTINYDFSHIPV